jgi:hypothetical protein
LSHAASTFVVFRKSSHRAPCARGKALSRHEIALPCDRLTGTLTPDLQTKTLRIARLSGYDG